MWVCFAIGRLWFGCFFISCSDLNVCFSSSPKAKPASTITFTRRRRCRPLQKNAHHSASNCSLFLLFSFCSRGTFYCFRSSIWSANTQCFFVVAAVAAAAAQSRVRSHQIVIHTYVSLLQSVILLFRGIAFLLSDLLSSNKTNNFCPLLFTNEI